MPLALTPLLITGAGGTIVRTSVAEPVPLLFVAEMVMEKVPATVGIPEMYPVKEFTLKPAGRGVAS